MHLVLSHMTGDASDRPCVWSFFCGCFEVLSSGLYCDHIGRGGPGFSSLESSSHLCGHGGFQQMILCFSVNLNGIVIFPSVWGWQVVFWFSGDKIPIKHLQINLNTHQTIGQGEGGREGEDFCCPFVIHSHYRSIVNKGSGYRYKPSIVKTT